MSNTTNMTSALKSKTHHLMTPSHAHVLSIYSSNCWVWFNTICSLQLKIKIKVVNGDKLKQTEIKRNYETK